MLITTANELCIRWMIRADMARVLAIEEAGCPRPWGEEDMLRAMRQRSCFGMVIERDGEVMGHMLYDLAKVSFYVRRLVIADGDRRQGLGRALIEKLMGKLSRDRRKAIIADVPESVLDGQLFLKAIGFRAVRVMRGYFADEAEDGYRFAYSLG